MQINLKHIFISFVLGIFSGSFVFNLKLFEVVNFFKPIKSFFSFDLTFPFYLLLLFLFFFIIDINVNYKRIKKYHTLITFINFVFLFLIFYLGNNKFITFELDPESSQNINYYSDSSINLKGTIYKIEHKENSSSVFINNLLLSEKNKDIKGNILIVTEKDTPFRVGENIKIQDNLKSIENFSDDFSYVDYLKKDQIYNEFLFPEIQFDSINKTFNFRIKSLVSNLENHFEKNLEKSITNEKSLSFLKASILGNRENLTEEMKSNFARTGLSHIVAISGLHIGIIGGLIYFFFLKIIKLKREKTAFISTLILAFYVIIIGASPASVRAFIMCFSIILFQYFGNPPDFNYILFFSASLILFFHPLYLLYDLGFQLSFLSLIGIVKLSPIFLNIYKKIRTYFITRKEPLPLPNNKFRNKKIKISNGLNLISASFSAQITTLWLTVPIFKILPVFSFISNFIILPILPILIVLGIVCLFLPDISPSLAFIIGNITTFLTFFTLKIVEYLSFLPVINFE